MLNTFVIFISRVIGFFVDRVLLKNEKGEGPGFFIATIVAELVLGVVASMVVAWFSGQREYRAVAGGASLAGRDKMIAALERLRGNHEQSALPAQMSAFGISGGGGGFGASSGVDPDEFMFYSAMGMIAAHHGNPPAAPALRAQARQIATGQLDPLSALELSAPPGLAGTGLMGGVLALAGDMAPLIRKMGLFMAALAVPRMRSRHCCRR